MASELKRNGLNQTIAPADAPIQLNLSNKYLLQSYPTQSCTQQTGQASIANPLVLENHFVISNINLKWSSIDNGLDISLFKVTIQDPSLENGEYICVLASEELNACAGFDIHHIPFQADLNFNLPLKCGEVKFNTQNINTPMPKSLSGTLRMVAYQTCNEGCANRVVVDTPITLDVSAK